MVTLHEIKLQGFKVEFSNCFVLFIQKSENVFLWLEILGDN